MTQISFEDIKSHPALKIYTERGNDYLGVLGYTDHSAAHTMKVSATAAHILITLGYPERTVELSRIAGYIHDIGNVINRQGHDQSGALMAFTLLSQMGMDPGEVATIVCAIGNHDEGRGLATDAVSAAIIIADKTDVRRSRVRNKDFATFDIHDRVNYAVEKSFLTVNEREKKISLRIELDTKICSVMDYFEIFLSRMLMCKRAAEFLGTVFELTANQTRLL